MRAVQLRCIKAAVLDKISPLFLHGPKERCSRASYWQPSRPDPRLLFRHDEEKPSSRGVGDFHGGSAGELPVKNTDDSMLGVNETVWVIVGRHSTACKGHSPRQMSMCDGRWLTTLRRSLLNGNINRNLTGFYLTRFAKFFLRQSSSGFTACSFWNDRLLEMNIGQNGRKLRRGG